MNHEQAQALLDAYVDGQLAITEANELETHVDQCDRCRAWIAERRALISKLRATPLRYSIPPDLTDRLRTQLVPLRRWAVPAQWARALAAGLVFGVIGLWVGRAMSDRPGLDEALVDAHVRSTLGEHDVDVASSSHHTVKPWLSNKLPFSPPVPELNDQANALLGARIEYIEGTPMAALVYQHGNHRIDVYVWPRSDKVLARSLKSSIDGFRVLTTQIAGFDAAFVSDVGAPELDAFRARWSERAGAQ